MRFLDLKKALQDFSVFSVHEIDSRFHRRRLNDWRDKGYLRKVIKGHCVFSDQPLDEKTLFEIASPEKAILDYFYINPHLESPVDFEQLRIDPGVFAERTDKERLVAYLRRFAQKRMIHRMNSFLNFIENA